MKKYINVLLFAALALAGAACDKTETPDMPSEGTACLKVDLSLAGQTRAADYDPWTRSTLRIFKIENGEQKLIRKYSPATQTPDDVYLVEGDYKVTVEAGDASQATFTNKTYYGEQNVTLHAHQAEIIAIQCKMTNIAVKVVYAQSLLEKLDAGYMTYVSAADEFSKTEAMNNSVPTLRFPKDTTGFFLLPADVSRLTWGFYGHSDLLGKAIEQTGAIDAPVGGMQYTLTFQYSKTPDGYLSVSITTREYEEKYDDGFIFSPQPTLGGDGFEIDRPIGFHVDPVRFRLTSIDAIRTIKMTAAGNEYVIMENGAVPAAVPGIEYIADDEYSGTIALGEAFCSQLAAGINALDFTMTDSSGVEGKATAQLAIQGIAPLEDYDLWNNTATFRAIVTDPAVTDVKIRYRAAAGEWKEVAAVKTDDYVYAAAVEPSWTEAQNGKGHTIYTPDTSTGIWAGRTYEYSAVIGAAETAAITSAVAGGDTLPTLNDSGLSCYTQSNTSQANFWGSGNNGTTKTLCTYDGGSQGAKISAVYNSTTGIVKMFAPGNLFTGTFNQSGMNGAVSFGNKYAFSARPSAISFTYSANIGTVDYAKHAAKIAIGQPDKASIYVAIIDWTSTHNVTSGVGSPSGPWSPEDGTDAVAEGRVIGYGIINPQGQVPETTHELKIHYYDKTARPAAGNYSLVIACATSAFGDYINGCSTNTMLVRDFTWKY